MSKKWSNQQISDAVKISKSFCETCRNLGARHWGGSYYNIRSRVLKLKIDISHFDKSDFCRGKPSLRRKALVEILVLDEGLTHRVKAKHLNRALMENGRKYECESCRNTGLWMNEKLVLEVDHINENWKDNRLENLRFLCPNCHTIKKTA